MNRVKTTLLAAISIAISFTFSACTLNIGNGDGDSSSSGENASSSSGGGDGNPSSSSGGNAGGVSSSGGGTSSSSGTSGGSVVENDGSFEYEGQTYKTVVIGTQTWMAENLNVDVEGSKCYDDDDNNCEIYGRLYTWNVAMDLPNACNDADCSARVQSNHQGICPGGWHIPTNDNWGTLENYVGGSSTAARYLKATNGWNNCGPDGTDNAFLCEDNYEFMALPGGIGNSDGSFSYVGDRSYWWSSSNNIFSNSSTNRRSMEYNRDVVNYTFSGTYSSKTDLLSVRCVKD